MDANPNEVVLKAKLTQLEQAHAWSPGLLAKLESFTRSAEPFALYRVSPRRFARQQGVDEIEALDLFVHAAKLGLFRIEWRLICPGCSDTLVSLSSLSLVNSKCHCSLCRIDVEGQLDQLIHVSFTLSSEVRRMVFHDPEQLSLDDYFYRYRFSPEAMAPDGVTEVAMLQQMIQHAAWLQPGEVTSCGLTAPAGIWAGHDLLTGRGFRLELSGPPATQQQLRLEFTEAGFEGMPATIAPGPLKIELRNTAARKVALAMLLVPPGKSAPPLSFPLTLTGNDLLNSQTFRDLYRSDTIRASEGIAVRDLTLVFTDLKGSTAMYERVGDLRAFSLVQRHFEHLTRAVHRCGGAVVKTIGDAVMASFARPTDAVRAALQMRSEIDTFNREEGEQQMILKIGVHRGPSIAVTLNERLDYFGQTVNVAARVQGVANADEICVTREVLEYPGVKELLGKRALQSELAQLKGVARPVSVSRVVRA